MSRKQKFDQGRPCSMFRSWVATPTFGSVRALELASMTRNEATGLKKCRSCPRETVPLQAQHNIYRDMLGALRQATKLLEITLLQVSTSPCLQGVGCGSELLVQLK
eukprot:CAMPEP_0194071738 /NCGR_PEP_ID=MMETSP0009_2-20130614/88868_1 /TAXON_ID=210454 /ORGANISM="Grammatophora oceanica, Strain CCMP 410" /LENGTH=105 /DNA_ID=CAMNT_0038725081 /DNA_START=131 /DNA_END=448 /DNA_ORIENTATION=+